MHRCLCSVGTMMIVAVPDFTLRDQSNLDVTLSDHFDAGVLLLFLRGDW